MNKFEEIVKAWRTKWKPSPAERELAERRLAICGGCESRKEFIKGSDFFCTMWRVWMPIGSKSTFAKEGRL